jgi:hypothetical protein
MTQVERIIEVARGDEIDGEEWRDVVGWEGLYEVSSEGRVRSVDRYVPSRPGRFQNIKGKTLNCFPRRGAYREVNLSAVFAGRKRCAVKVHRLVAKAFIPNPDELPYVNHKDADTTNNRVCNLEWCSAKYNVNYGECRAKNQRARRPYGGKVVAAYDKTGNEKIRIKPMSAVVDYGYSFYGVRDALCGNKPTYGGLRWRYIDEHAS